MEEDFVDFLRSRDISQDSIEKLKEDKVNLSVIAIMTEDELAKYIVSYGDRLAIRAFCRQRLAVCETTKSTALQRLRNKIQKGVNRPTSANDGGLLSKLSGIGNKHASKETRRLEIGWLHFHQGQFHQVRTKHGGGTRHVTVKKNTSVEELMMIGKDLFFPKGISSKGPAESYTFEMRDFSQTPIPFSITVNELYEQSKLRMLRLYVCTMERDSSPQDSSDSSSDFALDEPEREMRVTESTSMARISGQPLLQTSDPVPVSHSSFIEEEGSFSTIQRSREENSASTPDDHKSDDVVFLSEEPGSSVDVSYDLELEDSEIQIGIAHDNVAILDDTLPWNTEEGDPRKNPPVIDQPQTEGSSFAEQPTEESEDSESMNEIQSVKVRRVNIVKDVLEIFSKSKVLKQVLRIEFTNENAIDADGVSRELYTAFWEEFLAQCEGEEDRVPRLRPDYSEGEWQAVGRVWVKGYVDYGVMPIRLSPAFILACIDGVDSVTEELLMSSFLKYLSASEQSVVEKAVQGGLDENDAEDLLDLFSRMGSYHLPPKENIRSAILTMAHKVLLQEPKFIIDCFQTIMPTGILSLTRQSILDAYESKKATNKKVVKMLKPAKDYLNQQEQLTLNHLQRYVKNLDQRKLETFLRFCTGSTVMCKDKIEVMFNGLFGLGRRPVAHTCGAVLDLPCTYSSYPEFRAEFDNVLNGDYFAMDIV